MKVRVKKLLIILAPYFVLYSAALFVFGIIYGNVNLSLFDYNRQFGHALHAFTWLQGQLNLTRNYPALEIALYNDMYWISFPPMPAIIMLPLVAIMDYYHLVPHHLVAFVVYLLVVLYAYKIAFLQLKSRKLAVFFALFLCVGTNYLHVALWGAVWHLGQNMAFMFMLMAVYYAITPNKRHGDLALFFLCCAMGCRPLQVIYAPLIVYLMYKREGVRLSAFLLKLPLYGIPALILGSFFLWLNYARFGSVLEFGHNHLPASVATVGGQFSRLHMLNHLRIMFFRLPTQLPLFSPLVSRSQAFAFWLASPLVISYGVYWAHSVRNYARYNREFVLVYLVGIPLLLGLHLLALSMHKDTGGRQFGYRYTIDILVVMFFGLTALLKGFEEKMVDSTVFRNLAPFVLGLTLNLMGTIDFIAYYHGFR